MSKEHKEDTDDRGALASAAARAGDARHLRVACAR